MDKGFDDDDNVNFRYGNVIFLHFEYIYIQQEGKKKEFFFTFRSVLPNDNYFKKCLQGVTLGGTGKEIGDRHPKIGQGALIGARATILGNIDVGEGAMVAAGSLVLKSMPPHR